LKDKIKGNFWWLLIKLLPINVYHLLNAHIQTPMHRYHKKYSFFSRILDVWLFMKGAQGVKKSIKKKKIKEET
jgi:hypothetical protein